jgi:protein TonB
VTAPQPQSVPIPRIVDTVLGAAGPPPTRWLRALAGIAAVGIHAGLLALAVRSQGSLEPWAAELAMRIHAELGRETFVEPTPPPPPPPEPPPPEPEPPPRRAKAEPRSEPPPPAQAGKVIAQDPGPAEPLDLTGNVFVTGTADAYAGGVTSSSGTNPQAVESRVVEPTAPPRDLSAPVGLAEEDWRCPWPALAESADVNHAVAIVKVRVRADGTPTEASVVSDPGMGFGEAAVACALRARYQPARNSSGAAVASLSPPIRVRFTR